MLWALTSQLESSQWLAPDVIADRQRLQLHALLNHAVHHSDYVRECLAQAGASPQTVAMPSGLQRLPVLTRHAVQSAGSRMFASGVPRSHLPLSENRTSGSSGIPVAIRRTAMSQLFWHAFILREHRWFKRDFSLPLAIIRADHPGAKPSLRNSWGVPVSLLASSGPSATLPIATDVSEQGHWLQQINPGYLLTYPTNLAALVEELQRRSIRLPRLRQVRTISETVSPHVRAQVRSTLGVEIVDTYSSQELGIIAIQCPVGGLYHTMAENLIVEVLHDDGSACQVGETGRVVVTDLSNLATPLLRYELGDYAEVGSKCACGRGLPTLKHINGRRRNMLVFPDGRRHWPMFTFVAQRLINAMHDQPLRTGDGIVIALTATMGWAKVRPGEELSGVITRADHALMYGKTHGRDQYVMATD